MTKMTGRCTSFASTIRCKVLCEYQVFESCYDSNLVKTKNGTAKEVTETRFTNEIRIQPKGNQLPYDITAVPSKHNKVSLSLFCHSLFFYF